ESSRQTPQDIDTRPAVRGSVQNDPVAAELDGYLVCAGYRDAYPVRGVESFEDCRAELDDGLSSLFLFLSGQRRLGGMGVARPVGEDLAPPVPPDSAGQPLVWDAIAPPRQGLGVDSKQLRSLFASDVVVFLVHGPGRSRHNPVRPFLVPGRPGTACG